MMLPNLIVGAVGNGQGLPFVEENLRALGCLEKREPGANARRLALICAATVLCGELSLLAAQTNAGELLPAHLRLEHERRAGRAQAFGQCLPGGQFQNESEMRHGHEMVAHVSRARTGEGLAEVQLC